MNSLDVSEFVGKWAVMGGQMIWSGPRRRDKVSVLLRLAHVLIALPPQSRFRWWEPRPMSAPRRPGLTARHCRSSSAR